MNRYVKKPIVVEATQWFKGKEVEGVICMIPYLEEDDTEAGNLYKDLEGKYWHVPFELPLFHEDEHGRRTVQHPCWGWVHSPDGGHVVHEGDYIITGTHGERYPCKPEIFNTVYEKLEDEKPWENTKVL